MAAPIIEFIPARTVVASDRESTLDVLIRITLPAPTDLAERPAANLSLVIDRSGSMNGERLLAAKASAAYIIERLSGRDRAGVVSFDDQVMIVPSVTSRYRAKLIAALGDITAGGSTALCEGWHQGALQVLEHHDPHRLNRVILLTDGHANIGESNPDAIASLVKHMSARGVSTSALGIGDGFNEDLLEAMSLSGDGNYYYIQEPDQLPAVFLAELNGLLALFGRNVSLGIKGLSDVRVVDVFNDLEKTAAGNFKLPNLTLGAVLTVAARLRVPAIADKADVCSVRLAWDAAGTAGTAGRQELRATLQFGSVPYGALEEFPTAPEVSGTIALLLTARARKEAVRRLDRGDAAGAQSSLADARDVVACMPPSAARDQEEAMLQDLGRDLSSGAHDAMRKKASYQAYTRRRSRPE